MNQPNPSPLTPHTHFWQKIPHLGLLLFYLGLFGGVALRLTIFMKPFGAQALNAVWYIGTIAYIIFYFFRILIEHHRREICHDHAFEKRLSNNQLTAQDVAYLQAMMASLGRSKVLYNYVVWLMLSVVTLVGAILFV